MGAVLFMYALGSSSIPQTPLDPLGWRNMLAFEETNTGLYPLLQNLVLLFVGHLVLSLYHLLSAFDYKSGTCVL